LEGGWLARTALNNFNVITLCTREYVYGMVCNRAKWIGSNLQWWRKLSLVKLLLVKC
jgi:hypothetical protein